MNKLATHVKKIFLYKLGKKLPDADITSTLSLMGDDELSECYHQCEKSLAKGIRTRTKPIYIELDQQANKEVQSDLVIHWLYGDLVKKIENIQKVKQVKHVLDMSPCKKSSWVAARHKILEYDAKHEKTTGQKLDDAEETIEWWDGFFFNIKFAIVILLIGLYFADYLGVLNTWNTECRNDIALYNYNCLQSMAKNDCQKYLNQDGGLDKIFYCSKKDFFAQNSNFCYKGYCQNTEGALCKDTGFKKRFEKMSNKWKQCMYKQNKAMKCSGALQEGSNDYGNCDLGVEIF